MDRFSRRSIEFLWWVTTSVRQEGGTVVAAPRFTIKAPENPRRNKNLLLMPVTIFARLNSDASRASRAFSFALHLETRQLYIHASINMSDFGDDDVGGGGYVATLS